jgi:hypothetical protein
LTGGDIPKNRMVYHCGKQMRRSRPMVTVSTGPDLITPAEFLFLSQGRITGYIDSAHCRIANVQQR